MFNQMYPVLLATGVLMPSYEVLDIENVYVDEACSAGDVMQFDTNLVNATSFIAGSVTSAGVSTCAFGRVHWPDISATTKKVEATAIYGVAMAAAAAAGTVTLRVIGRVTNTVKAASATDAVGDQYMPTVGGAAAGQNTLTVCADCNGSATVVAGTRLRKIVAISLKASATTTMDCFFNGFGFGYAVWDASY